MERYDVLLISRSGDGEQPDDEPPRDRIELGPDLILARPEPDFADLLVRACTAPGHPPMGAGIGPGPAYVFLRQDPPGDIAADGRVSRVWDQDQAIITAVALSRLVRPNGMWAKTIARIERDDPEEVRIFSMPPGSPAYVTDPTVRSWLVQREARGLAQLVERWRQVRPLLADQGRLLTAFWWAETAAQTRFVEPRLVNVVTALEALLNTGPDRPTAQFTKRFPRLADEVGLDVSRTYAGKIYDARSTTAHGAPTPLGGASAVAEQLKCAEAILRGALRNAIESDEVRFALESDEGVQTRWGAL